MLRAGGRAACAWAWAVLLAACAAQVPVTPATLAPLPAPAADLVMGTDLPIRLTTGYQRTLPARSTWRAVGALPQGTVYRPVDAVFTIEGHNVHEAYLVVKSGALHGFYLPGESNYSALAGAIPLPLATGAQK